MHEEELMTGPLEPTSEPYAVAKLAGMKMCEAYNRQYGTLYFTVISPTLFGPGDDFDPDSSHVLSALISRFHGAKMARQKRVELWGSGTPRREFMYVDDLAEACLFLMNCGEAPLQLRLQRTGYVLNVGCGRDVAIRELASLIARCVRFEGEIVCDVTKPDGAPRKLLDSRIIRDMGWVPKVSLEEGLSRAYEWFVENGQGVK
jgi:GDP-L-fucose synthase